MGALLVATNASAGNPLVNSFTGQIRPKTGKVKTVTPTAWCKVDRNGKKIGSWHIMPSNSNSRNAGTANLMWGNTNGSGPGFFYSGTYGTPSGWWYFGDQMNARIVSNDAKAYASGEAGGLCRYIDWAGTWNPNGTDPYSGTGDLVSIHQTFNFGDVSGFGPADVEFVDGIAFLWDTLPGGYYIFSVDLTLPPAGYLQMGRDLGSVQMTFATVDGSSNIVTLPASAAASTDSINFLSPGDANFPGTNPSSSDTTVWYDLGTFDGTAMVGQAFPVGQPDYLLTGAAELATPAPAELYDMDGGASTGVFEPMQAFYSDSTTRTIKGTVDFQGLNPSFVWYPSTLGIFVIDDGTNQTTAYAPINDDGTFTIYDPNQATGGNYTVTFIPDQHWLIKNFTVNTTGGSANAGTITVINGDCDLDNVVSVFDYIHLSDNFDKEYTSEPNFFAIPDPNQPIGPGNVPICFADLDHDGVVSVFDYIVLSDNFDLQGDPLP